MLCQSIYWRKCFIAYASLVTHTLTAGSWASTELAQGDSLEKLRSHQEPCTTRRPLYLLKLALQMSPAPWCLSLFIHHHEAEPALISLQVLVLLGLVQSAGGCKYMGLQEALAHLYRLMIGQQTASPGREKCTVVFLLSFRPDKSLNLLPQIKIAPVAGDIHEDRELQHAVILV